MNNRLEREREKISAAAVKAKEHLTKYPYELEKVEIV